MLWVEPGRAQVTLLGENPMAPQGEYDDISSGVFLNAQKLPQVGKYMHTWGGRERKRGVAHSASK